MANTIFEKVGGRPTLEKVRKVFYDKVYEHEWLGLFFKEIDQVHIENQQTDFMTKALGGPALYSGRLPIPAHKHMFIPDDLFKLRHEILKASLIECKVEEECIAAWLKIDKAFQSGITKKSPSDCEKRFFTDDLIIIKNPSKKAS